MDVEVCGLVQIFGHCGLGLQSLAEVASQGSHLLLEARVLRLHLCSGVLKLLNSLLEHLVLLSEILSNGSLVVEVEACGLQSFDLDIFILRNDIFTGNLPHNIEVVGI